MAPIFALAFRTTGAVGLSSFPDFIEKRQQGNEDDANDHRFEMLRHPRNVSEPVAGEQTDGDPGHAADDVKQEKFGVRHRPDAGHERGEGPDDGHKPGQDNRLGTIFLVELVRTLQMLRVEEPGFLPLENLWPQIVTNPVVHGIAQDCCHAEDAKHQPDVELSKSREGTRREQQRIAREKGRQHQSGFAENHEKEDGVDMRAIVGDQLADVFPQVENGVEKLLQKFHLVFSSRA